MKYIGFPRPSYSLAHMLEPAIKNRINMKRIKILDIASILTICGILFYFFGWMYWSSFYKELNIDVSFIDIPYEKLIVTTWIYVLAMMGYFFGSIESLFHADKNDKFSVFDAFISFLSPVIVVLLLTEIISIIWFIIINVIFYFLILVSSKICHKYNKNMFIVPYNKYLMILFMCVFLTTTFFVINSGKRSANELYGKYTEDVEVVFNNSDSICKGKFIAVMDNRYFLLVKKGADIQTVIIESNVVNHILQINMNKKTRVLTPGKPQ
jgi:hypothetical protein